MEPKELLAKVGLTERESKVYLALLELGSTTTGPLVKKSGVPNSKIYEILESLQNKGLVSWIIKGKIKYFQASDPNKILTLFKEKEKEIESLIPILKVRQVLAKEKNFVELYEGSKAIFAFLNDLIEDAKKGETYYSFSLNREHEDEKINIFYRKFGTKREEKKLIVKILANKETKEVFKKVYADRISSLKKIVRFTDLNLPQGVIIFRNHFVLISWTEEPIAIHIQSKKVTGQYKKFFEDLWKKAKF